jgi:hypothetical protein
LLQNLAEQLPSDEATMRALERLSQDPVREQRVLKKVVKAIDQRLTSYFRPEKEIGTFGQLLSGFSKPSSIKIEPEPSTNPKDLTSVIQDQAGKRILFDCGSRVAFSPAELPTPHTVLSSLCGAGTLGEEVVGFNQATLVELSTRMLYPDPTGKMDRSLRDEIRNEIWNSEPFEMERHHYARSVWRAVVSGLGSAAFAMGTALRLASGATDLWSHALLGAAAVLAVRALYALGHLREVSKCLTSTAQQLVDEIKESTPGLSAPKGVANIRALPSALISHLVSISGGRERTLFGAGTEASWKREIPEITSLDESTLKHQPTDLDPDVQVPAIELTIEHLPDKSPRTLPKKEVERLAWTSLIYATHVERSAHAWNVAHAIEVLRGFMETENIQYPNTPWPQYTEMLKVGRFQKTNELGVFPDMQEAFGNITLYLSISRSLWDVIALPLQAAHTLERIDQTRRAQRIASAIVQREAKIANKASV